MRHLLFVPVLINAYILFCSHSDVTFAEAAFSGSGLTELSFNSIAPSTTASSTSVAQLASSPGTFVALNTTSSGFTYPYSFIFTVTGTVPDQVTETFINPALQTESDFIITGPTIFTSVFSVANNLLPSTELALESLPEPPGWTSLPSLCLATPTLLSNQSNANPTISTQIGVPRFSGDPCGDSCGRCNIFYPTVSVLYWPVASQDTACLGSTDTTTQGNVTPRGDRGTLGVLSSDLPSNLSSFISNGYTFEANSAYIVLPSISASNMCGPLGGKHTSVTWPIATSDLSSVVGNLQDGFQSFQFNFTNALCPPSPEPVQPMTASGQPYRPVIAPPVAITNIDPMWVSNCWVGSPWQGIDPPIALKPAKNLSPATTKGRVARLAFATPSASMKAIPIQTSPPKQITSGHQPLKSLLDYLVIEHRSTGNRIPTVAASPTDLKGPSDPSHTTELADHDDSPGDTFRESYPDPSSESPSDILQDKNKDPGVSLQESYALTHDSPSASAEVTAAAFLSSSAVTTPLSFSASPNHVVVAGKPHSLISAATHLGSQSVVTPSDPQVATNLDPISAFTRSSKTFTPSTMIATLNGSRMSLGAQTMGGIISGSGRGAPSTSSSSSQGQQLFLGNAIRNTADFGRVFGWVLLTAGGLYGALRIAW